MLKLFFVMLATLVLFACDAQKETHTDVPDESVTEHPIEAGKTADKEIDANPVDENGKPVFGPGTDVQRVLLAKAKTALISDDWDTAEREFLKLTKTEPLSGPSVTAHIALAEIYTDDHQPEKAVKLLERLSETEFAEVQFVIARALVEAGETTKAMRAYEKTIHIQPDYLQAIVELAGLYAKSGKKEQSEKLFFKYEKKIYSFAKKLESPDTPVEERAYALEVFTFVNDDRANQAIVRALADPEWAIRVEAVDLTRDLRLGSAKEKVADMMENDPNLKVRMTAKEAMKTLKDAPVTGAKPVFEKKKKK